MTELAIPDQLHAQMQYAKALAASNLLPKAYQQQPANVLLALDLGRSIGISPAQALAAIAVVNGRPTMSASLQAALVRRAGHKLRVSVLDEPLAATAELTRADDPDFTFEAVWTMERAQKAGLWGSTPSWKAYPQAMLAARAQTEVIRLGAPDVLIGIDYDPDELDHPQPATTITAEPITAAEEDPS